MPCSVRVLCESLFLSALSFDSALTLTLLVLARSIRHLDGNPQRSFPLDLLAAASTASTWASVVVVLAAPPTAQTLDALRAHCAGIRRPLQVRPDRPARCALVLADHVTQMVVFVTEETGGQARASVAAWKAAVLDEWAEPSRIEFAPWTMPCAALGSHVLLAPSVRAHGGGGAAAAAALQAMLRCACTSPNDHLVVYAVGSDPTVEQLGRVASRQWDDLRRALPSSGARPRTCGLVVMDRSADRASPLLLTDADQLLERMLGTLEPWPVCDGDG
jgi:hypothetical protein